MSSVHNFIWPSELICRAMNIELSEPKPPKGFKPTKCVFCGRRVDTPDEAVKWTPSNNFADYQYAQPMDDKIAVLCLYCGAIKAAPLLSRLSKCAVSLKDGYLSLSRWEDVKNFFLNPPEAPFIVCYSLTAKTRPAHLFWRAPVTLDRDHIFVQLGTSCELIRRKVLLHAVNRIEETGINPFEKLHTLRAVKEHGSVRFDVLRKDPFSPEDERFFLNLTDGEVWALSFFPIAKKEGKGGKSGKSRNKNKN